MSDLQLVILTLAVAYAVIGALLLVILVYARLHWSLKAAAVVVTSAFYVIAFGGTRGLLGWASSDRMPAGPRCSSLPSQRAPNGSDDANARARPGETQKRRANCSSVSTCPAR